MVAIRSFTGLLWNNLQISYISTTLYTFRSNITLLKKGKLWKLLYFYGIFRYKNLYLKNEPVREETP